MLLTKALQSQTYSWILLMTLQRARHGQDVNGKYNTVKNLNVAPEACEVLCFHKQLCYCCGLQLLLPLLHLAVKASSYQQRIKTCLVLILKGQYPMAVRYKSVSQTATSFTPESHKWFLEHFFIESNSHSFPSKPLFPESL